MAGTAVEVGFTDKLENPLLYSPEYFPSKIGGHPAWLNPSNLPLVPTCPHCSDPLIFFAQIYAGLDRPSNGYHRMLYLFCCRRGSCYKDGQQPVKAFRSQIAADNPFYGLQPVPEGDADTNELGVNKSFAKSHNGFTAICGVCGCRAPLKCSRCQKVAYCSKQHQKFDWQEHKLSCSSNSPSSPSTPSHHLTKSTLLFRELDIVIERERETENAKLSEDLLAQITENSKEYTMTAADEESLTKEYGVDGDPAFTKFKERISRDPEQVLRYARHDTPLWPTSAGQCGPVPACGTCGGERSFEVQFLPTLLYVLGLGKESDGVDWASVVVYTCREDCEVEEYVEEFCWVQRYGEK